MSKLSHDQKTDVPSKIEMDKDDFLKWFETIQYISNESHSIHDIISVMSNELGGKEIKAIICAGIQSYSEDNDSSNIVSRIHKQFELSQLQNIKSETFSKRDDNTDDCFLQNEVFDISDVSCYIFQYLDLKSRLRCKNVNLTWLYNACNPAAYYHLNLHDFICCDYDEYRNDRGEYDCMNEKTFIRGEKELTKLIQESNGNIRKLTLCQWPNENAQLFSSMVKNLTKLESIDIVQPEGEEIEANDDDEEMLFGKFWDQNYPTVVENLLSISRESIKSVKMFAGRISTNISGSIFAYSTMQEIFTRMQKLLFPKLTCFSINCAISHKLLPINISQQLWMNHSNLKTVEFRSIEFEDDFFKDLMKNEVLMANIETLILIDSSDESECKMFPVLLAKLTNVMHLELQLNCGMSSDELICMLSTRSQASRLKSMVLRCRSLYNQYNHHHDDSSTVVNYNQQYTYTFDKLEKLDVDCANISKLKQIFNVVFKPNTISNIEHLTVQCSANTLITTLLRFDHAYDDNDDQSHAIANSPKSRNILLPKLKYVKCSSLTDNTIEREEDHGNAIKIMKNISHWLDLYATSHDQCDKHSDDDDEPHTSTLIALDMGTTSVAIDMDRLFHFESEEEGMTKTGDDDDHKDSKKLSQLSTMLLKELIHLNRYNNVDCNFLCDKGSGDIRYDLDPVIEQMKKLNMVSSNDVQKYIRSNITNSRYRVIGPNYSCYSLFNHKISFEQDYFYVNIVTQSKEKRIKTIESK